MISKAEQYRCYGEKALASAKQATCEEEKAELFKIAETWFELAEANEIKAEPTAATKLTDVRYWHKADAGLCAAHVCFRRQSGHGFRVAKCLLMTQSGHPVALPTG